jgi:hypothetical protein
MLEARFQKLCELIPEIQLYILIDMLGGQLFYVQHDDADRRLPKELDVLNVMETLQEKIQYAVAQTTRFGVKSPMEENKVATPEYWAWFRWWKGYVDSLDPEQSLALGEIFETIDQVISGKEEGSLEDEVAKLAEYRPAGDWKTQLS